MFIIRWIVAAIILVFMIPWQWALAVDALNMTKNSPPYFWWVIAGCICGIGIMLIRRPNWFIHTFIHEAAHFIACICMGVKVKKFQVSDGQGGFVIHNHVDPIRSTIISLAPYTLPLLLAPLMLMRYWAEDEGWRSVLSFLVVFFFFHHLHGLYHNVKGNFFGKQADISKAGKPLSVVTIISSLLLLFLLVLKVLFS